MFTDIEGSTELLHQVGDEHYEELLATHQRIMREAFDRHEGAEVDTQGDSFFVAFPRAWNAVHAAVDAQRSLSAFPWAPHETIRVRMGIHTGEPRLVNDHDYVGLDVHRGARVGAAGHGGQVLISERTYAMMAGTWPEGVTLNDLGEHRLKGLAHPEHIYQLVIEGLPAEFPPIKTLEVPTTNLPQALTTFVGRAREAGAVTDLLTKGSLVTLVGPGGAGKTRLSQHVAETLLEQYRHGVWLVELAPLAEPQLVPQAVATVLGVRELPGRALTHTLVDAIRSKQLLLVLDNCEHLVEPVAQLAHTLLRSVPGMKILATSREPLGVPGEVIYRVPPLSRPEPKRITALDQLVQFEAVQLFVDRATAGNPAFALTDRNAPAVLQVVNRLDGIPLAIELAAARVKSLSVEQIAARLDDRFRLLTGGARGGLPHHQTLRAAMDWGYELLSDPERRMLRRVAVFAGSFSLASAERACVGEGIDVFDVLDLLARLVDKSMVVAEGLNGDTRYRLLETVRRYGWEQAAAAGEQEAIRARHLDWTVEFARECEPDLRGSEQIVALDRLELDHDDLRGALEWSRSTPGVAEVGLQLAAALHRFWGMRGYLTEGREWLKSLLAAAPQADQVVRAKALYGAAQLAVQQGDYPSAAAQCEESLALSRAAGDHERVALALNLLGLVARNRAEYGRAEALLLESLEVSRTAGTTWPRAEALSYLGLTVRRAGDMHRAQECGTESLAMWREIGDKRGLAASLDHLGTVARYFGDYDQARIRHEESLALRRELGHKLDLATSMISLGAVALEQGDHDRAKHLFEESLLLCRELGYKLGIGASLGNLAIVAHKRGDQQGAKSLLGESKAVWAELDDKRAISASVRYLGEVARSEADHAEAVARYRESLALSVPLGDRLGIAESLEGLAAIAVDLGEAERAARLLGAAERMRETIHVPVREADRPEHDRAIEAVRASLDEAALLTAWGQGRAMGVEEAVSEALSFTLKASSIR